MTTSTSSAGTSPTPALQLGPELQRYLQGRGEAEVRPQVAAPFPASRAWSLTDDMSEAVRDLGAFGESAAWLFPRVAEVR